MSDLALDTSAAVAFLLRSHTAHSAARRHVGPRRPTLTGHSLAETYSVLTRLPGDARLAPLDAVTLLEANFGEAAVLDQETAASIHSVLAPIGVAGGAVYDALVALAARQAGLPLATRDRRAAATYSALLDHVELVTD
jgi:predicted nucleic acid-binding protein